MTLSEPSTRPTHRQPWAGWLVLACLALMSLSTVSVAAAEEDAAAVESEQEDADQDTPAAKEKSPQDASSQDEQASDQEKSSAEPPSKSTSSKAKQNNSEADEADEDDASTKAEEQTKESEKNEEQTAEEDTEAEVEVEDDSVEVEPEEEKDVEEAPPIAVEPDKVEPPVQKRVIGATATLMEKKSELLFRARVDSGAKSCSLHIEEMKIENESEQMADNIGKVVRFLIKNGDGESHWLEAKISGYVIIKTSDNRERRYKVPLTFRYKDFEKQVLVTLNNRENMEFPLLLGRNFLRDDFVVDVSVDSND